MLTNLTSNITKLISNKSQPQVNDDTHRRYVVPNKETHIKDIYNIATQDVADINSLISLFKGINPSYERLYSNKSQRQSMERLVKKYGVENISAVITEWLPKTNAMQFSPQIHTPQCDRDNFVRFD